MPQLIVVGFVVFLQWLRRKLNKKFYKCMRKSEIFAAILSDVSSEVEIDSDRILSSERKEEVVDARYLVIFLLLGNGFYPAMIAEKMGLTQRAVRSAISGFGTMQARSRKPASARNSPRLNWRTRTRCSPSENILTSSRKYRTNHISLLPV